MSKEIVQRKGSDLAFSSVDEEALKIMELDSESYVDDTATEDIAMPRIALLQSGSKQLKKSEAGFIKGAEEGDFCNTLTNEILTGDQGFLFVPVKRRVVYLHWKDVDAGGGLIENFGEDPTEFLKIVPNEKGHRRTSETTEIVKTYETFGYFINPETGVFSQVLLSLASTQGKKQRKFNALIRSLLGKNGKTLPEYSGVYKVTSTPEKNEVNSWYTFEFNSAGFTLGIPEIGQAIYNSAKQFREMIDQDQVNVKYEQDESEGIDEETDVM